MASATSSWSRPLFRSLRFRLIASYSFVIFVCLLLAGSTVVILLRDYQQRIRMDEYGNLSVPISLAVQQLDQANVEPRGLIAFVRQQTEQLRVRILLTDRTGLVIEDTGNEFDGQRIPLPSQRGSERLANTFRAYYAFTEEGLVMVAPPTLVDNDARYKVILAVPQANLAQAWLELLPGLGLAAFASLFASVLVALFLTRSIARPLVQMTRASEEMARGRYDQSIPVRGQDEVARLSSAFNAMAAQVATSDRTMRDFLANVSHELRTPLTSIQGFSLAMLDGTARSADEFQQAAGIINEEALRMRALVDDLLTLSKIESGQIAMGEDVLDLDRLLREAARRVERRAETNGVRLAVESAPGAFVRGDPHWLAQVFSNLIENGLRYTPSGGELTIGATSREQPLEAVIRVHNTGSYIPREDLPRVFERFFQVDRSRSMEGSGLGLAIVREVVQAHGGAVEAASDPATGTTFIVRLPLHSLHEAPPSLVPFSTARVA